MGKGDVVRNELIKEKDQFKKRSCRKKLLYVTLWGKYKLETGTAADKHVEKKAIETSNEKDDVVRKELIKKNDQFKERSCKKLLYEENRN